MPAGVESGVTGRTAWLSQGFEELLVELAKPGGDGRVFDVLIAGSGYGGAIAAAGLAGCVPEGGGAPIDVCVLERGREYLSGMFPSQLAELPQHTRLRVLSGVRDWHRVQLQDGRRGFIPAQTYLLGMQ